jgi:hypothetical protein
MIFILKNYDNLFKNYLYSSDYWICESLIYKLCAKDKEFSSYNLSWFILLNDNQKNACSKFLEFLFENNFLHGKYIDDIVM